MAEAITSSTSIKAVAVPLHVVRYPSFDRQAVRAIRASCLFERVKRESSTNLPSICMMCWKGIP